MKKTSHQNLNIGNTTISNVSQNNVLRPTPIDYMGGGGLQVSNPFNAAAGSFDPLFVEDPLAPGNNVGRNCFRILQVQRSWSEAYNMINQHLRGVARDGVYHSLLEILVGKLDE